MSVETNPHNYTNMNNTFSQFFMPARNSPKENSGANGKFLPKPLLFHLRLPNSKTNEPKFWQILSPKNSFAKTSSALFRHLPETLRAEPRKKNTLSFFKRNFTPAKSRKQGVFFLSWMPRLCEAVAERFIHHSDFARNTFELCPEHTAKKRNRVRKQKYGRHEVPSVLNSPQKILNPKGFATQSVAPR